RRKHPPMHRVGWLVDWVANMAKSRLINEEVGEKHLNYGIGIAFLQLKPPESSRFNRQFPDGAGRIGCKTFGFLTIPNRLTASLPIGQLVSPCRLLRCRRFKT
ncbi:MAG: hypothetical protein ACKN9U_12225, partial [Pirellulaceae bacterium]